METTININKENIKSKSINISIEKIYILSVLLLPILSLYSIGISTYSLGDLFLTISLLLLLFKKAKTFLDTKINIWLVILIIYILMSSIVLVVGNNDFDIMPSMRYVFYLFNILFFALLDFDKKSIINIYLIISMIVAIILIAQFISKTLFNYPLSGIIPFLKTIDFGFDLSEMVYTRGRIFFSVFIEPSHYGIYILPAILICLFLNDKKKMLMGIFFTFTVFLSLTFTGILGCAFVWGIWLLNLVKRKNIPLQKILICFFVGLCLAFIIIIAFDLKDFIFNIDEFIWHLNLRIESFLYPFQNIENTSVIFWGHGMDTGIGEIVYLSGIPRTFYYYGIIGSAIYLLMLFSFCKRKTLSAILMLLVFILMIGTEFNLGQFFIVYMLIAFSLQSISLKDISNNFVN